MNSNWLLKRVGIFISIYILMLILAEVGGLKPIMQKHLKSLANTTFSSYGNGGNVEFKDIVKKKDQEKFKDGDVLVVLTSKQQINEARAKARKAGQQNAIVRPLKFGLNSWWFLGILLPFFIALVIAIPATLKNKVLLFIIGFFVLNLYMLFKIWVFLTLKFSTYYSTLKVGWTNHYMLKGLSYISNIVAFPFFGFLMILVLSLFFLGIRTKDINNYFINS